MTDVFTKDKRSDIMRKVKSSKNDSTENKLINYFKSKTIKGWRRNCKVYGKPDFIFPKERIAIFVDGCFWHGHDCRNTRPKQNENYWQVKISKNMERDVKVTEHLEKLGWLVIRIWECELKRKNIYRLELKLSPLLKQ